MEKGFKKGFMRKLKSFSGGNHPPECKKLTLDKALISFPIPKKLYCLLSQHIGVPARAIVKKGDYVKRGQMIAEATEFVSCPVHAPTSGTVLGIEPTPHPSGKMCDAIVIESDGKDVCQAGYGDRRAKIQELSSEEILKIIQDSGIVGMGGAAFPTHVKFSPPKEKKIDTFIINASECEPYLTCDHRLILQYAREILKGAKLLQKVLDVPDIHIGIEANKYDAYDLIQKEIGSKKNIHTHLLKVKYPQGAEKQLIKAVLNRTVPAGGLPMDVGVIVQNVASVYATYRAVYQQEPLTERYVTVTGSGIEHPQDFLVRLGTPIRNLLEHVGLKDSATKIILGGPMMGLAQYSLDVPVTKGTNGIVVLTEPVNSEFEHCIRCGDCVRHCPMFLLPYKLSIAMEKGRLDLAEKLDIKDCMECGVCSYVCPANRPIVHFIRMGKAEILKKNAEILKKKQARNKQANE